MEPKQANYAQVGTICKLQAKMGKKREKKRKKRKKKLSLFASQTSSAKYKMQQLVKAFMLKLTKVGKRKEGKFWPK